MSGATVTVKEPLTLELAAGKGGGHAVASLDRIWRFCAANRARCPNAVQGYVANTSSALEESVLPIDRTKFLPVVRPSAYIAQLDQDVAANPAAQPVARPLAGDLSLAIVRDEPRKLRFLNARDLEDLALTPDGVMALAMRNITAALRPMDAVAHDAPGQAFFYIEGDDYESSRILLHEEWAQVAKRMGGELLLAVPGSRLVIYGDARRPGMPQAMASFVRDAVKRSERPISATLFKWTPEGWEPLPPW